jgi:hypothetical protein
VPDIIPRAEKDILDYLERLSHESIPRPATSTRNGLVLREERERQTVGVTFRDNREFFIFATIK